MPIYGIMFVGGLAAGLLSALLAVGAFVFAARGRGPLGLVLYLAGFGFLFLATAGFWFAWGMTRVRIPPGG